MSQSTHGLTDLAGQLALVRGRIEAAAERCHRSPDEITLIAVTKTHPIETVRLAIDVGLTHLGENRVQEAEGKIVGLGRSAARWHLIGHLQANKARRAVKLFDMIHSVDCIELAERLERHCVEEERPVLPVLIQVDLAGEATKSGVKETELEALAGNISQTQRLRLQGLMIVPPFSSEPEAVRPFFKRLRGLRDTLQAKSYFGELPGELSMGMTHDFEIAIEEGATMVRIGTALFGARPPQF